MTIEEIFTELVSHMKKGLSLHDELTHLYGFLNLKGYQKQQEYQYLSQSKSYIQLKQFYLNYYRKMIIEKEIQLYNLIPQNWYKYKKENVDISTKRTAIRDLFNKWLQWEENTQLLLNNCYKQLYDLKQFTSCDKILSLLNDVNEELTESRNQYINLESSGYDIVFILESQQQLYKNYIHKIKKLYRGDD